MPSRTEPLRAWVTKEEKQEVKQLAKQAHLTTSELVRRLVTGRQLPDAQRHEDVLALLDINADLARLGNLLRLALDDPDFTPPDSISLDAMFEDMRNTQLILKKKIESW